MTRKSLWKTFSFTNPNHYRSLEASLHGLPARKKYVTTFEGGWGSIETNLPYSEIRAWFHFVGLPLIDHVTDTMPLSERVKEWEKEDEAISQ